MKFRFLDVILIASSLLGFAQISNAHAVVLLIALSTLLLINAFQSMKLRV
jgi:hypothetical protein